LQHGALAEGYRAAQLDVRELFDFTSGAEDVEIFAEQLFNVASQDVDDVQRDLLVSRLNAAKQSGAIDAAVVLHGTDTLEETAFLLHCAPTIPIVLTGAFRPANALGADGAANISQSVVCAQKLVKLQASAQAIVCLNAELHDPRFFLKTDCIGTRGFSSGPRGLLGCVAGADVLMWRGASGDQARLPLARNLGLASLPRVEIVYPYSGMSGDCIDAWLGMGVAAFVVAGFGIGTLGSELSRSLQRAASAGAVVVRSSRVPFCDVRRNAEVADDEFGFVAGRGLSPVKARVLARLALAANVAPDAMQALFDAITDA
jgi:L-asparaginase